MPVQADKVNLESQVSEAGRKLSKFDFEDASLPWRKEKTPYRIFLAEFLLVRTRADVVTRLFETIVTHYPDFRSITLSGDEAVGEVLKPLGLQKRVPYLIKAAQYILEHHNGQVPTTVVELLAVPGLGFYTASAIAAFAYDLPEVPADVNILRFVSRLTGLPMEHKTKGSKDLLALLPLLAEDKTGLRPQILLDFTRLICRPREPKCEECPLRQICRYANSA
jgi:A/G-specific adenine glycosylase